MKTKNKIKLKNIQYKYIKYYILYPITIVTRNHNEYPPKVWNGFLIKPTQKNDKILTKNQEIIFHEYPQQMEADELLNHLKNNVIFNNITELLNYHREE